LDFDGIDGRLEIATEDLDGLGKLFGAELPDRLPLTAKGHLLRRGDDWRLETGTGAIAGAAYEGTFALAEGTGREANAFRIALSLDDLNLDRLVRSPRPASTPPSRAAAEPRRDWRDWRLPAPTEQDDRVEAAVKARRVTLGGLLLQDLSLHLSTAPGRVALAPVSASLLGGRVEGSVTATAEGPRRRLAVALASGGLDAEQVLRLTPANGRPLAGHLDLRADLAGTGAKLGDAVATARGHLVAAMTGGQVSRSLFRAAATDLAALFDEARGRLPLACLLAVAEVRDGVATIAPFRLRTSEGTLFAGGRADLPRNTVDATIRTERTGFLALDVPLHVTGRLDSPTVSPVIASAADAWKAQAASVLDRLPPALGKRVAENGCVR
jgi:uncharacterized protein involved in outer membrane biogenesis